MTFDEYQQHTKRQLLPEKAAFIHKLEYYTIGMVGEAGEVANKVKKIWRDQAQELRSEDREKLKMELGDVLWYVSQLADYLDLSLNDVARANIEKNDSRLQRGVLQGDGDNR